MAGLIYQALRRFGRILRIRTYAYRLVIISIVVLLPLVAAKTVFLIIVLLFMRYLCLSMPYAIRFSLTER